MRQILNIAYYEIRHILKDPILLLIVVFIPLVYATLFGAAFVSGVLRDIPTGIVDLDNSAISREISTAYQASSYFKVIEEVDSYPQLEQAMKDGTVRSGVVIPKGFGSDISQHRANAVLIIYDGSNLIWGYNVRKNALEVLTDFNARHGAAFLAGLGYAQPEIKHTLDAVSLHYEVWYNPTFSYVNFLFMGIMMMIIHQVGLLTSSLTITREKDQNTWIQFLCAPIPRWKIFLGKSLPYFTANFVNYGLLLWLSAVFIHAKIGGSAVLIMLLGLLFSVIIVSIGFIASVYAPNSLQVTRYVLPLAFPVFIISGYTWPATHIPATVNGLAQLLPYTWMSEGFRMIAVKELGLSYVWPHFLVLSLMAAAAVLLALTCKGKRDDLSLKNRGVCR